MNKKVKVNKLTDDKTITQDATLEIPNKCPACNVAYNEQPLVTYKRAHPNHPNQHLFYSIYFCPHCEICFFVKSLSHPSNSSVADIIGLYPLPETITTFSDGINNISPQFVTIYQQAESAENNSLSEICGLGYRKALEFLIKDYCVSLYPDKEDEIQKKSLSKCIKDYVDNHRIKALSEASAWLGNDETHYIRKHPEYNLNDLKAFINATVAFIDSELAVIEAEKLLATPK